MKLKTSIILLILSILIISCVPKNIQIETPAPVQQQEQPKQEVQQPKPATTKTTPLSELKPSFERQEEFPAANKEYYLEGSIFEAKNDRYKIRIDNSIRSVDFTAPKFAFNVRDRVGFTETGSGEVKNVKKISSAIEPEKTGSYKELFVISEATPGSKVYESTGSIIEASPTRYTIRDDLTFRRHSFFSSYNIDLAWGDGVSYRMDDRGNIVSVRIISKYLP